MQRSDWMVAPFRSLYPTDSMRENPDVRALKIAPSLGGSGPHRTQWVPWVHPNQHPERHHDRLSRFCRAHGRNRQTDRQTDRQTVCSNRPHLAIAAMRPMYTSTHVDYPNTECLISTVLMHFSVNTETFKLLATLRKTSDSK